MLDFSQKKDPKQIKELPSVGQISPITGMTGDYINEICFIRGWSLFRQSDPEFAMSKVVAALQKRPRQKYRERYPVSDYVDVVTDKNRDAINRLDKVVDEFNARVLVGGMTWEELEKYCADIHILIYGETMLPF